MSDYEERKHLIERVLTQWYARDIEKLRGSWFAATQHVAAPMLRMAVDEICSTWTKAARPQPGDVNALAQRERKAAFDRPEENLTLAEMRAQARQWLEANKMPMSDENVMRRVRSRIGVGHPRAPLSDAGWLDAVAEGVVTHEPKKADESVKATSRQVLDLWRAGYGWCDRKRAFVPAREAVDLDFEAEENGTPFPPRSMTDGAIAGAHAQLVAGKLAPIPKREPVKSGGFERLDAECPF